MTMLDDAQDSGPLALKSNEGLGCVQTVARERPILFSAPMVRALLAGTKTQTRRVVAPASGLLVYLHDRYGEAVRTVSEPGKAPVHSRTAGRPHTELVLPHCPYGKPGDRLWVRETWAAPHAYDAHKPAHIPALTRWHYAATEDRGGLRLRSSIHMPRVACRLALTLQSVRVERLQEISKEDARAEGYELGAPPCIDDPLRWYRRLWDEINGAGAWDANPWVWVLAFHCCPNLQPNR